MPTCSPTDYACRIANGEFGGPSIPSLMASGTQGENATAGEWWKVTAGVIMLAVIIDYAPRIGGWLLLLIVVGLALSPKARAIIVG